MLQTLRKIRACEGEAAAQLLLEMLVAQEVAAERERWDALRSWVEQSRKEHEAGQMMSIAESIYGAAAMRDVLNQMARLQGPNAKLSGCPAERTE